MKWDSDDIKAARQLLSEVKKDDSLYFLRRSTSRSGMTKKFDVYHIEDNMLCRLTWSIAVMCNLTYDKKCGHLVVKGTGFNASQDVLSSLELALGFELDDLNRRDL